MTGNTKISWEKTAGRVFGGGDNRGSWENKRWKSLGEQQGEVLGEQQGAQGES